MLSLKKTLTLMLIFKIIKKCRKMQKKKSCDADNIGLHIFVYSDTEKKNTFIYCKNKRTKTHISYHRHKRTQTLPRLEAQLNKYICECGC